jgi:ATP-dependent DNA helicase RecG
MERGSYVRIGESDRRLTSEEVQQVVADRGQPQFDHEVILEANQADLAENAVAAYVHRTRVTNPRIFVDEPDDVVLRMTKVLARGSDGKEHPTLAGLLSMGRYPQQFFPQLNLTFVHYPTPSGEAGRDGVRFLDNARLDGPIPEMAAEALNVIRRNMTRRAFITGEGRRDMWEYPPEALREAVVNALVHRDLSPGSRGIQVQIEMYPDRLRIMNPGGLFGGLDIDRLGEEGRSSARNGLLMKLLEDVPVPNDDRTVCENRGSGIRAMLAALRQAGMGPPRFKDSTTAFEVVLPNHTLLDDEAVLAPTARPGGAA